MKYFNMTQKDIDKRLYFTNIDKFIDIISNMKLPIVKDRRGQPYYNIPISFDIETSSFYDNREKRAIMYEWTLCIDGVTFIGREWRLLFLTLDTVNSILNKGKKVIYVHNLQYEFQFLYKRINFKKVFAIDNRKVCYAEYQDFEFRCSYLLSGASLELVGINLTEFKVKKLKGALDYSLIRTPLTNLTHNELSYCIYDCLVVCAYIQEMISIYKHIFSIPYTKTGKVRKVCRERCRLVRDYRRTIDNLTIEVEEYALLKSAFMGGFTHANATYAQRILENVYSFDECSAYPSVMIAEKFPMSKGKKINISEQDIATFRHECLVMKIRLEGLRATQFEHPISRSRCLKCVGEIVNNGRIVNAQYIEICCTDVDYNVYSKFYTWDNCEVLICYAYHRDYLPKPFLECVLDFYETKTKLKDVVGREKEYSMAKENLNSLFGMTVTDISRPCYTVENNEWTTQAPCIEQEINNYNKSKNRFLFYPWGVFITAYARRNLFSAIYELKNDFVYSDTDSVKFVNFSNHKKYFDTYNENITQKLQTSCRINHLNPSAIAPITSAGVKKPLGVWEQENGGKPYRLFKTLGAKRYAYFAGEKFTFTVAGCGKKRGSEYLKSASSSDFDCMNMFNDDMYIPASHTDKLTHTYCDEEIWGVVRDYKGDPYEYHELSFIHLSPCDFSLSLSDDYKNYLMLISEEYTI